MGKNKTKTIALEPRITRQNTPALLETLRRHRNSPVQLDAGAVRHIGASGFELLLAAARSWRADGVAFAIAPASTAFMEGLAHIGLPADELGISEGK